MFNIGDVIIHPLHGAGTIMGFKEWGKDKQRYYIIELLDDRKTNLMVPTQSAKAMGLRAAIAYSELDQVWQVLSATPMTLPEDHKKRYKMMTERLHTRETLEVVSVVRDMVWRRHHVEGNLAQKGKEILQKSVRMLAEEISASPSISRQKAEDLIQAKINNILPARTDV